MKKLKTDLRSVWWRKNASSSFLSNVAMDFAPSFIKNGSLLVVAENHHFPGFMHLLRKVYLLMKVHLLRKPHGNRHLLKSYRKWRSKISANFTRHAIYSDIG